jgi:hypothetical protein
MTVTINASTSNGLISTADTSGALAFQANGTTKLTVDSTGAYGQLVSGTAVASTSGTSIDFTSLPSWVKRVTVIFNAVSISISSNILIQLGTASSVETTGYTGVVFAAGNGAAATVVSYTTGIPLYTNASYYTQSGNVVFTNISGNTWIASGVLTNITTVPYPVVTGGAKTLGGVLTRVRITTVNGTDTFSAGSINIMYEG